MTWNWVTRDGGGTNVYSHLPDGVERSRGENITKVKTLIYKLINTTVVVEIYNKYWFSIILQIIVALVS